MPVLSAMDLKVSNELSARPACCGQASRVDNGHHGEVPLAERQGCASLEGGKGSPGLRSRTGKPGGNPTALRRPLGRRGGSRDYYRHRPTTTLPRRGRSTTLAGYARSSIPLPPGMSRAVLLPRCARARPAPCPAWLAMSTAPRRAASAWIAPSLRSVTIHAVDAHDVPLRGWRTNAFRILAATPLA